MIKIYKYPLLFDQHGVAHVYAPLGSILKVALQDKTVCVWIEHQIFVPEFPKHHYSFKAVMTGEELPETFAQTHGYIDTVFMDWLVVHIFEEHNPDA